MIKNKAIFFLVGAFCFAYSSYAQQKTEAEIYKQYVSISNVYKQLPLQLTMQYKKNSNLPMAEEDTANYTADFYMQKEGAYMKFGDAEQLINDSLVLMIVHSVKQMVVMQNNAPIEKMLQSIITPAIPDSVAEKFLEEYSIQQQVNKSQASIHIKHKRPITGTALSYQEIALNYDAKTNLPQKIETITRSLVPIAEDTEVEEPLQVVTIKDKGRYVLKVDYTEVVYKSITHHINKKLPGVIADKITIDKENNYTPVKAYENYFVTQY